MNTNVWWWKNYPERDKEWVCHFPPNLSPIRWQEFAAGPWTPARAQMGIYVQIPFCEAICANCDYNKFLIGDLARYLEGLHQEIDLYAARQELAGVHIPFVYFGGGTPSILTPEALRGVISHLKWSFSLAESTEISVECHPITVTLDKLREYQDAGVNRISIGAQSFHNQSLSLIKRGHTAEDSEAAIRVAKSLDFIATNVDLMFGLPGQTLDIWRRDLAKSIAFEPEHVSCYEYVFDPYGHFAQTLRRQGLEPSVSEDTKIQMTFMAFDMLEEAGFEHYKSQSSCGFDFAKPGKMCSYEVLHVGAPQTEYLALGAGARGFFNGYVYFTIHTIAEYLAQVSQGHFPILVGKKLTLEDRMSMFMVLGTKRLRVSKQDFYQVFGKDINLVFGDVLEQLSLQGLIEQDDSSIRVTKKGRLFGDNISKAFYNDENYMVQQPATAELVRLSQQLFAQTV